MFMKLMLLQKCVCVEEDAYNSYANFLVKYFLAEGVMCGHALLVAGPSLHTADILKVWSNGTLYLTHNAFNYHVT